MLTTKRIVSKYGGNICRHCINAQYHIHLYPADCVYEDHRKCPRCREVKNIVGGFQGKGVWKMLLKL